MIVKVQAYQSSDGYIHATEEAAHKHDIRLALYDLTENHESLSINAMILKKDDLIKILLRL